MRIVVAYKWTCDPEEATARADGTVDWSRAKPGKSTYDPVAMELARQLAGEAGVELIGVTVGGKGVAAPIASRPTSGACDAKISQVSSIASDRGIGDPLDKEQTSEGRG